MKVPKINQEEYEALKNLDDKWKWIARDQGSKKSTFPNELRLYKYKPQRPRIHWLGEGAATKRFGHDNLFQFIKHKDSEPYSIAELIREYEFWNGTESEEIEVKKDLDWAKKEIKNIHTLTFDVYEAAVIANNKHFQMKNSEQLALINKIFEILDQLDEPEVLSYGWISDNAVAGQYPDGMGYVVPAHKLQNLLVPKQEEPTQEQVQKYNVKFKVKSSFGMVGIFLYKKGDEVLAGDNFGAYYPKKDEYRLTEKEIRNFQNGDILFEHFAVKVE